VEVESVAVQYFLGPNSPLTASACHMDQEWMAHQYSILTTFRLSDLNLKHLITCIIIIKKHTKLKMSALCFVLKRTGLLDMSLI